MIGTLELNNEGKVVSQPSAFQPSQGVIKLTSKIRQDYEVGVRIQTTPYREFGGESISFLQEYEMSKRIFTNYEEPSEQDPTKKWRDKGIKPVTRNKVLSMGGHIAQRTLFPNVFAQNDNDEEDKDAASVMKDLVEWNVRNSNYPVSYLFGIIAALVYPVAYWKTEFAELMQTIKNRTKNGIVRKEVIDDVFSGFQLQNVPGDEILITNPYEFEIQRQRAILRRRFIDIQEAEGLHGQHENFKYVGLGIRTFYDASTGIFYDRLETDNPTKVEEVVYMNRKEDTEVPYVNGIYLGDENPNDNPIKHRDHKNRPKYPYVKFGYHPIDEKRFYFYKSLVSENGPDQRTLNRVWQMIKDGKFLEMFPPLFISGERMVSTGVIYPGATHSSPNDFKVTPVSVTNASQGYELADRLEASMNQTSVIPQLPAKSGTTAYAIAREEEQAQKELSVFLKMLSQGVKDLGYMLIDIILRHQTVGEVMEITGGKTKLKFPSFILPQASEKGKKVTKKITLTNDELTGTLEESQQLLKEAGGIDADTRIYKVNPSKFSRLRFLVSVDADQLLPKNEIFEKALKMEGYDRMHVDPYIKNQEAVTRDFLVELFAKNESDKYMGDQTAPDQMQMLAQRTGGAPQRAPSATSPGNVVGQITGRGSLASLVQA